MKTFKIVIILILAITCHQFNALGQDQEFYYYGLGKQPLTICDSIVSVKFNSEMPNSYFETFAYEIEELDEQIDPLPGQYGFDIYHVRDDVDMDTLLTLLNDRPDVLYSFPVFMDSGGSILKLNDHFVLKYTDTIGQNTIDSIENHYNVETVNGPNQYTGCKVLKIEDQTTYSALDMANIFYESGLVEYCHPSFGEPIGFDYIPDDPLFQYQYYLYNDGSDGGVEGIDIDVVRAWEITRGTNPIIVAIIDDGCVYFHEDYDYSHSMETEGYDFVGETVKTPNPDSDPQPGPDEDHGTACQGIIFGLYNNQIGIAGIAPDCWLMPLKFTDDHGYYATSEIAHDAIVHAVTHGASIINCSWGWRGWQYFGEIEDAIDYANGHGVICVFGAGNYGEDYPIGESIGFPANLQSTIGVGAIERDGEYWLYSGSGEGLDVVAPSGSKSIIHGDVYTLDQEGLYGWNPRFRTCETTSEDYICFFGGTSAAAPQVSGILALVRSRRPDIMHYDSLRQIIDSSAIDGIGDMHDTPGWDACYGNGLASAFRALLAVSRGDADNSGSINVIDATFIINWLYKSGPAPEPDIALADADCSGGLNILDAAYIIHYLYESGPEPPLCYKYDYQ